MNLLCLTLAIRLWTDQGYIRIAPSNLNKLPNKFAAVSQLIGDSSGKWVLIHSTSSEKQLHCEIAKGNFSLHSKLGRDILNTFHLCLAKGKKKKKTFYLLFLCSLSLGWAEEEGNQPGLLASSPPPAFAALSESGRQQSFSHGRSEEPDFLPISSESAPDSPSLKHFAAKFLQKLAHSRSLASCE